jgi:hypothetical protein
MGKKRKKRKKIRRKRGQARIKYVFYHLGFAVNLQDR